MLLSIAMIVKDEEKNIEKCLESVNLLKSQIDLEIIIIDTGSTDNTVSLAEKYTSKIYFHKWENDFAKMRNISLGYCEGEWILVLDADEELINPWELVDFFSSGLYVKYNSATVNIKSSNNEDNYTYSVTPIIRLFKRTDILRYFGKIHEQPQNCSPTYTTSIEFKHKGYYLNDYKLRIKKFKRNSNLLLSKLNEKDDDIYTYYQLYSTFLMFNHKKEAIDYLLKAEELVRKTSSLNKYLYVLLSKANELYQIGEYSRATEQYEEILKLCPYHIDAMYVLIQCYIQQYKIDKAELVINEYIKRIDDKNTWMKIKSLGIESEFYNKKDELLDIKIKILYQREQYELIIDIYNKEKNIKNKILWINIFVNSCIKAKQYKSLAMETNKLVNYDCNLANNIIKVLDDLLLFEKTDTKKNILNLICKNNRILNDYVNLFYDDDIRMNLVNKVDFGNYNDIKGAILKRMVEKKINIFEILENLQEKDLDKYLNYLCKYYEAVEAMNNYSEGAISSLDYHKLNLQKQIDLSLINSKVISNEDMVEIVFRILINNEYYIRNNKYEEDESSAALHELYINMGKMNYDLLESIRNIKKIVKESYIHPQIVKSIIEFIGKIPEETIVENIKKEKEHMISAVIELISSEEQNNLIEAKKILNEMKKILKYDYIIYNLLGVIDFTQGNIKSAILNFNMSIMFNSEDYDSIYSIGQIMIEKNRKHEASVYFQYLLNNCTNEALITACKDAISQFKIDKN